MPLSGAAIGPDAVMVWTGERELTRFDRSGARGSFTVPVPPLASQIGSDGIRVVDSRGTVHRYSLTGRHETAVPLRSPLVDGVITAAALAAHSPRLALVIENPRYEDSGDALVFEDGVPVPWHLADPYDGYREVGVDLSDDGRWLLVNYHTFAYFTGYGSAGYYGGGVRVIDVDGNLRIDHEDRQRDMEQIKLSPGGDYIAWTIAARDRQCVYFERDDLESCLDGGGRTARLTFAADLLGAVYTDPAMLEVVQLSTRRRAQLELPEEFGELVFCGDDAVVVHPELGAWWIPIASLVFEDAE